MTSKLILGDCLEVMQDIPDNSIDLVLTDPPYGTTACKWDSVIPFEPMWKELKRITKDNGAVCLFGSEPFSSALRMSNVKMFKYDWYWKKNRYTNFLNAKHQPMRGVEVISLFYKKMPSFYPTPFRDGTRNNYTNSSGKTLSGCYREHLKPLSTEEIQIKSAHDCLSFDSVHPASKAYCGHPTQKPVPLLEYLIKTYTLEDETVLDFTMGSGSTGVACKNLGRSFVGIENDEKYFEIAESRIDERHGCQ